MDSMVRTIVLMGLPGSGKGTQGKLLAERLNGIRFSTGDRFRTLREGDSALSKRVAAAYESGRLFPDWFATHLFEDAVLKLSPETSIVFDGFPRTRTQAESLDETMDWLGRRYQVINLMVPEEEALRRQIERAKTDDRPDSSTEDKVRVRFEEYQKTAGALDFFRENGTLTEIDGVGKVEDIAAEIATKLGLS